MNDKYNSLGFLASEDSTLLTQIQDWEIGWCPVLLVRERNGWSRTELEIFPQDCWSVIYFPGLLRIRTWHKHPWYWGLAIKTGDKVLYCATGRAPTWIRFEYYTLSLGPRTVIIKPWVFNCLSHGHPYRWFVLKELAKKVFPCWGPSHMSTTYKSPRVAENIICLPCLLTPHLSRSSSPFSKCSWL